MTGGEKSSSVLEEGGERPTHVGGGAGARPSRGGTCHHPEISRPSIVLTSTARRLTGTSSLFLEEERTYILQLLITIFVLMFCSRTRRGQRILSHNSRESGSLFYDCDRCTHVGVGAGRGETISTHFSFIHLLTNIFFKDSNSRD